MIKNVLFDLDGTLLPMDMDEFTGGYFKLLVKKAIAYSDAYTSDDLIKTIWGGVKAMVTNNGEMTNEEAFWKYFASVYGEDALEDKFIFDEFYANEFEGAKAFTGFNPEAKPTVEAIKAAGYKVVLATNPIFPAIATIKRCGWTGLDVTDFEAFTTYENSAYSKPNPQYYIELLKKLKMDPAECLMVGNDVTEDMEAGLKAGMQVFLITDCMINKEEKDINNYPHGTFADLREYLKLK